MNSAERLINAAARSPIRLPSSPIGSVLARLAWRRFAWLMAVVLIGAGLYGAVATTSPWLGARDGMAYAAVIGTPLALIESHAGRVRLFAAARRLPFLAVLVAKSVAYAIWIVTGALIAARLTHPPDATPLKDLLIHREMLASAVLVTMLVNVLLSVGRLLGPGVLGHVLAGRYHWPRREERGFIFLDVRGATGIAERIGDVRFHAYLGDLFRIVEGVAIETGGEIHDYIGDAVMLSWPVDDSDHHGPLAFIAALGPALGCRQSMFRARYGAEAEVRIGAHAGSVVAGQIGELRQKVVFLGDTVNTAARIEQLARDDIGNCLVTAATLERFAIPRSLRTEPLGKVPLRGKAKQVEVHRVAMTQ